MKSTSRISFFVFVALLVPFVVASSVHGKENPLVSDQQMERYGLKLGWFNQVEIDVSRSKVTQAIVEGGTLFLVSNDAKLHAFDAESGKMLWIRSLGDRNMIIAEPSANSRMVAVHNGLELFVFNRKNGKILFHTALPGAASAACEISENYVYVPMLDGKIVAYPLEDTTVRLASDEVASPENTQQAHPQHQAHPANDAKEPENGSHESDEDPVLTQIQKSFEATKKAVLAEPTPAKKEPEILLRGAIGIPMVCQSFGNVLIKPTLSTQLVSYSPRGLVLMHREILTWASDKGALFAAGIEALSQEQFNMRYMVDSSSQTYYLGSDRIAQREWVHNKEIVVRPTVNQTIPAYYTDNKNKAILIPSLVVVGNKSGNVFAVKDRTGEVAWQFAAGGPILEQIAVIGTDVYCPTGSEGLHALDLETGASKWFTPQISKFVAASQTRLYTLDAQTRLVVLDRQTGSPMYSFDAKQFDRCLFNLQNDRIYFVNDTGLVQCLYERRPGGEKAADANKAPKPVWHRLTCKEYADVMRGKTPPKLYWMKDVVEMEKAAEGESVPEGEKGEENMETEDDSPFKETKPGKASGEDGSLDGNELPGDRKPKPEKPKTEDEEDPFG